MFEVVRPIVEAEFTVNPVNPARTASWDAIGTDVSKAKNIHDVIVGAGLDYTVTPSNILLPDGTIIPDKFANIDNTGRYLGIVGKDYEILQNEDAFDFVNEIDDELEFVKAGETHTGMVYVIAKLPSIEVFGDTITPNVILQNGHNGRYSLKTTIIPLRIACQNQFAMAFKSMSNTISIHHSSSMGGKIVEAKRLLQSVDSYMKEFKNVAETMYNTKLSSKQVNEIIDGFFSKAKNREEMSNRQQETLDTNIALMKNAYNATDNQNLKGSMFGLVNAYADFVTHAPAKKATKFNDGKFLSTAFDPSQMQKFVDFAQAIAA